MDFTTAGLKGPPFQAHGTPATFVTYSSQKAATRFLDKTRSNKRGMGLLEGPAHSGKTSIIQNYIGISLPADYPVAIVDGAGIDETSLLQALLDQFGFDADFDSDNERFNMIRVFATQQASSGTAPFVIVENLHALEPSGMVVLCELAGLDADGKSTIRMILTSDQPMMPFIRKPALRPILNRLTGEFHLKPLEIRETRKYIHKKLMGAGCSRPEALMPLDVCDRLHVEADGLPGIVDRLASIALAKATTAPVRVDDVPHKGGPLPSVAEVPVLSEPVVPVDPAEIDPDMPRLVVSFDGRTVDRVAVEKDRFMIGRSDHNDLSIDHEYISRQHAVLVRIGSATVLLDLKSRNETFVNGKRIDNQVLINNDVISIGDHRIKFIDPAMTQRTSTPDEADDATTVTKSIGKAARRLLRAVGD